MIICPLLSQLLGKERYQISLINNNDVVTQIIFILFESNQSNDADELSS